MYESDLPAGFLPAVFSTLARGRVCGEQRITIAQERSEHTDRLLSKVKKETSQTLVRLLRLLLFFHTFINHCPPLSFTYQLLPISQIRFVHCVYYFCMLQLSFVQRTSFFNPTPPAFPLLFNSTIIIVILHLYTCTHPCQFVYVYVIIHPQLSNYVTAHDWYYYDSIPFI